MTNTRHHTFYSLLVSMTFARSSNSSKTSSIAKNFRLFFYTREFFELCIVFTSRKKLSYWFINGIVSLLLLSFRRPRVYFKEVQWSKTCTFKINVIIFDLDLWTYQIIKWKTKHICFLSDLFKFKIRWLIKKFKYGIINCSGNLLVVILEVKMISG